MIDLIPTTEQYNQWTSDWSAIRADKRGDIGHYLVTRAAQWGADAELEKCCEWLDAACLHLDGSYLRSDRRPKPPSEAEQATADLDDAVMRGDCISTTDAMPLLRASLARLAELEALLND